MANFIVGVLQDTPEYGQIIRPIRQGEQTTAKAGTWAKKSLDADKFKDAHKVVILNMTASYEFKARPILTEDETPSLGDGVPGGPGGTKTTSKETAQVDVVEEIKAKHDLSPPVPKAASLPPPPAAEKLPPPPPPPPATKAAKPSPAVTGAPKPPPLPPEAAPAAKAPPTPPTPPSTPPPSAEKAEGGDEEAVDLDDIF